MEHYAEALQTQHFEVLAVLSVTYLGNSVNVEVNPVMRTYGVTKAVYVWLRFTRGIFFLVRVVVVAHFSPSEIGKQFIPSFGCVSSSSVSLTMFGEHLTRGRCYRIY